MERFAFKVDAALKANLYKICRLCGIDNPCKVPILPAENEVVDLDEPSLSQKVFELVGFTVTHNDKMPQTMCSLCVDKINDFYEFREMCLATNSQTRKLLGLKMVDIKVPDVKPIFKSEPATASTASKRGRKRKTDESSAETATSYSSKIGALDITLDAVKNEPLSWRKKLRLHQQQLQTSKSEAKKESIICAKKTRQPSCSVCGERFHNKDMVEKHKMMVHVPAVLRYTCIACNQSPHSLSDIKAHQLWHKLSKTPYQCPLCDARIGNNYAYSRHLREHSVVTPMELLVLDRECPLCKKTFITNFFYNTHPCARRTRKCGGCSRLLNSEIAYMRHAPYCAKIYLTHSKHILPEVANHEAEMLIKNEKDFEFEDNSELLETYAKLEDMQPVVVLERIASPILRASLLSNSLGRSADRVSSKKYLKRVDQLLKSTMNTLVSIKHEPEVHINDTELPLRADEEVDADAQEEPSACDDFQTYAGNDDSAEEDAASGSATAVATPVAQSVKQEPIDDTYKEEPEPSSDSAQIKQEPLKLKLKITKNHGQLNSSIVDDDNELQSSCAKKKKKRKHKERNKYLDSCDRSRGPADVSVDAVGTAKINIKQERLDESNPCDYVTHAEFDPQGPVMTSIPMVLLERSFSDDSQKTALPEELQDVKPNRLELDRLMQITHIASGVVMAQEAMPHENAAQEVPLESKSDKPLSPAKKTASKSTARKSTGGISLPKDVASISYPATVEQLPKIVAVESGVSVPFSGLAIKPEPLDRGYADEQIWNEPQAPRPEPDKSNEINHNDSIDSEVAYMNSLDISNVTIKQEKDIHISDVKINGSEMDNMNYNGLHGADDLKDNGEDDGSISSADEAEEEYTNTDGDQEQRIYREIELQPLDEQISVTQGVAATQNKLNDVPYCEKPVTKGPADAPLAEMKPAIVKQEAPTIETNAHRLEEGRQAEPEMSELETTDESTAPMDSIEEERQEPASENYSNFIITSICSNAEKLQQLTTDDKEADDQSKPVETQKQLFDEEQQQEPTRESSPNFAISSVCSHAEELQQLTIDDKNSENLSKTADSEKQHFDEEQNTSTVVIITAPKENETLAQPFHDDSANYNCAEEQENVLNHELSANAQQAQPPEEEEQPQSEQSLNTLACTEPCANEETENLINEQQQQQQQFQVDQVQQQLQQPLRLILHDDSNINEIAENNNNANIERELNDDGNFVQENLN